MEVIVAGVTKRGSVHLFCVPATDLCQLRYGDNLVAREVAPELHLVPPLKASKVANFTCGSC